MLAQSGAAAGTVQQVAALYSATSASDKKVLLRRAFGIEFRGTQYVAPNQQIAVISHVEEPSPYTEGVVNITTGPTGTQAPSVLNLKTNIPESKDSAAAKPAAKSTDEPWADDWNEELVDAADVANVQSNQPSTTETAAATPEEPAPTATVATATVTDVKDEDEGNVPLPTGSAGPVANTGSSTKIEKPVQVAEADGHAAGVIPSPVTTTPATTTTKATATTPSSTPASTTASSPAAVSASTAKDEDRATKRTQTAASRTEFMPATTSPATTSSTKDIQVASLPPAEATKPAATSTSSAQAKGEPKKLTADTGVTVTTQKVNAAKIYTVQIASFRKESDAAASWQMLKTEQADLAALPHNVEKADLGKDKGIYYRLQAGSFADKKDATSLCSSLQKRSIECMVVESKQVSMNETPAATSASAN